MKIRYERPVSHAATWAWRFGLFALTLLAVAAVMHRFGLLKSDIFATVFILSGALAALALLLAIVGLIRLWMVGAKGGRASAKGMVYSLLVLVPVSIAAYRGYTLPQLHDVSTDTVDVPVFLEPVDHRLVWLPLIGRSDPNYAGQAEAYPQVTGRRYEGAVDRVLEAVYLVAENSGIRITNAKLPEETASNGEATAPEDDASPSEAEVASEATEVAEEPDETIVPDPSGTPDEEGVLGSLPLEDEGPIEPVVIVPVQIFLQGETRTLLFGFESDISIRLSEEAETTFVDMRSVSRFGPHDFGANAGFIATFLAALDAELLGISVR